MVVLFKIPHNIDHKTANNRNQLINEKGCEGLFLQGCYHYFRTMLNNVPLLPTMVIKLHHQLMWIICIRIYVIQNTSSITGLGISMLDIVVLWRIPRLTAEAVYQLFSVQETKETKQEILITKMKLLLRTLLIVPGCNFMIPCFAYFNLNKQAIINDIILSGHLKKRLCKKYVNFKGLLVNSCIERFINNNNYIEKIHFFFRNRIFCVWPYTLPRLLFFLLHYHFYLFPTYDEVGTNITFWSITCMILVNRCNLISQFVMWQLKTRNLIRKFTKGLIKSNYSVYLQTRHSISLFTATQTCNYAGFIAFSRTAYCNRQIYIRIRPQRIKMQQNQFINVISGSGPTSSK